MEFTVEKEAFRKLVQQVSTAIPTRSTLPILNNILFEAKDGKLYLTASNMDFSIKGFIPVESVENVAFTAPGKPLLRILSTLDVPILKISYSERSIEIKWDGNEYKFMSMPAEEFPKMKEFSEERKVTVKTYMILEGFDLVGFCTAKDDPRPFLNGVLLEVRDNELRMVASDAHKLGLYIKKLESGEGPIEAILSKDVFDFLKSVEEEKVTIAQDKGLFSFTFERSKLVTRLIEGPYAPYREVIPKEEGFVFKAQVKELEGALRRIQEVVSQSNFLVEVELDGKGLVLKGNSESGEARERLVGEYKGEALRIGFNVKYLHEIIRHIEDDEVEFHFYGPRLACMIKPVHPDRFGYDLLYLLMPVSLE